MKDSRSAAGCGGVIVHPGRAIGSWRGRSLNLFSYCSKCVIEKAHEIVSATGYKQTVLLYCVFLLV